MAATHVPVAMTFTHKPHVTGSKIDFNNARVFENAQFKISMHTDPTVCPPEGVGRLQNLQNPNSPRDFDLRPLRPAVKPIMSMPDFIPIPEHITRAAKDAINARDKAETARFQRHQQVMALMLAFVCAVLLTLVFLSGSR
jgi:hypothetical protein